MAAGFGQDPQGTGAGIPALWDHPLPFLVPGSTLGSREGIPGLFVGCCVRIGARVRGVGKRHPSKTVPCTRWNKKKKHPKKQIFLKAKQ